MVPVLTVNKQKGSPFGEMMIPSGISAGQQAARTETAQVRELEEIRPAISRENHTRRLSEVNAPVVCRGLRGIVGFSAIVLASRRFWGAGVAHALVRFPIGMAVLNGSVSSRGLCVRRSDARGEFRERPTDGRAETMFRAGFTLFRRVISAACLLILLICGAEVAVRVYEGLNGGPNIRSSDQRLSAIRPNLRFLRSRFIQELKPLPRHASNAAIPRPKSK